MQKLTSLNDIICEGLDLVSVESRHYNPWRRTLGKLLEKENFER